MHFKEFLSAHVMSMWDGFHLTSSAVSWSLAHGHLMVGCWTSRWRRQMYQDTWPMASGTYWVGSAVKSMDDRLCCLVTVLTLTPYSIAIVKTHLMNTYYIWVHVWFVAIEPEEHECFLLWCFTVYFHTRLHPYKISHATRNHNFYSISPWFLQSLKGSVFIMLVLCQILLIVLIYSIVKKSCTHYFLILW